MTKDLKTELYLGGAILVLAGFTYWAYKKAQARAAAGNSTDVANASTGYILPSTTSLVGIQGGGGGSGSTTNSGLVSLGNLSSYDPPSGPASALPLTLSYPGTGSSSSCSDCSAGSVSTSSDFTDLLAAIAAAGSSNINGAGGVVLTTAPQPPVTYAHTAYTGGVGDIGPDTGPSGASII